MQAHAALLNRRRVERLRRAGHQHINAAAITPPNRRSWGADPLAVTPHAATPGHVPRANLTAINAKKKGSLTGVVGAA